MLMPPVGRRAPALLHSRAQMMLKPQSSNSTTTTGTAEPSKFVRIGTRTLVAASKAVKEATEEDLAVVVAMAGVMA